MFTLRAQELLGCREEWAFRPEAKESQRGKLMEQSRCHARTRARQAGNGTGPVTQLVERIRPMYRGCAAAPPCSPLLHASPELSPPSPFLTSAVP